MEPTPKQLAEYLRKNGLMAVPAQPQQPVAVGAPVPVRRNDGFESGDVSRWGLGVPASASFAQIWRSGGGGGAAFTGVKAGTYMIGGGSITINGKGQIININPGGGAGLLQDDLTLDSSQADSAPFRYQDVPQLLTALTMLPTVPGGEPVPTRLHLTTGFMASYTPGIYNLPANMDLRGATPNDSHGRTEIVASVAASPVRLNNARSYEDLSIQTSSLLFPTGATFGLGTAFTKMDNVLVDADLDGGPGGAPFLATTFQAVVRTNDCVFRVPSFDLNGNLLVLEAHDQNDFQDGFVVDTAGGGGATLLLYGSGNRVLVPPGGLLDVFIGNQPFPAAFSGADRVVFGAGPTTMLAGPQYLWPGGGDPTRPAPSASFLPSQGQGQVSVVRGIHLVSDNNVGAGPIVVTVYDSGVPVLVESVGVLGAPAGLFVATTYGLLGSPSGFLSVSVADAGGTAMDWITVTIFTK